MKIIFFGTPPFASKILLRLIDAGMIPCAVVTKPDKPKGRSGTPTPSAVKATVLSLPHLSIPIFQPEKASAPDFASILAQYEADLFVVVAYGEIIKQHLLDLPRLGCINVHASLLPKYRGAAPIQWSIINGENESGVTIMYMALKMDAGDMILKTIVPISPNMTAGELESALCEAGGTALLSVLRDIKQGKIHREPQNHALATLAPKLELEHCEVKWDRPAQEIHNLIRGVTPIPGAWFSTVIHGQSKQIKICHTEVVDKNFAEAPGTIVSHDNNSVIVACRIGALRVFELQLEGKKRMSAPELLRGYALRSF